MIFYGLKTCDTCRKAQKEMRAAGIEFEVIDVRADGVNADKLRAWTEKVDWKKLLNTRSTTWRKLEAADKENVDVEKAIALITAHPTLMKRPVIEMGGSVTIGWNEQAKTAYGL